MLMIFVITIAILQKTTASFYKETNLLFLLLRSKVLQKLFTLKLKKFSETVITRRCYCLNTWIAYDGKK